MNTRPLGRSALCIAPVVFGGNVFGWTVDQPTDVNLKTAKAVGLNVPQSILALADAVIQ